MVNLQMTARYAPEFLPGKVKLGLVCISAGRRAGHPAAACCWTTGAAAEGGRVVPLTGPRGRRAACCSSLPDPLVLAASGRRSRTTLRRVGRLGPSGLERLDLAAQVVGQVRPVRGLEAAQRRHRRGEVVTLPLQVAEHLATPALDLPIELLGPAEGVGLHPLGVDPRLGLDPLRPRPGVRGDLVRGPVGLLADPVGVLGGLGHQALGLLGRHLDQPDHRSAGLLAGGDHQGAGVAAGCAGLRRSLRRGLLDRGGLLGRGGRRRRLEGLDLLLEVDVLLDQLREALLDLVDELVDLQDLVPGLAGHPETLVAHIVQRQRHHSPRYVSGAGGVSLTDGPSELPYPIDLAGTHRPASQPTSPDGFGRGFRRRWSG